MNYIHYIESGDRSIEHPSLLVTPPSHEYREIVIENTNLPSPPLVGIEPNPGPRGQNLPFLPAIINGVRNVAKAARVVKQMQQPAQVIVEQIKGKKKRKPKQNKVGKNGSIGGNYGVPKSSLKNNGVITHHFMNQMLYVKTHTVTAIGESALDFGDGLNVTAHGGLTINPRSRTGYPGVAGLSMAQLADVYQEFKFTKLRIRYIPNLGSVFNGTMAFGITDDPVSTYPSSMQGPANCQVSALTPMNTSTELDLSSILNLSEANYYYTKSSDDTESSIRLACQGILVGYVYGMQNSYSGSQSMAAGLAIGTIEVSGTIQFRGIRPGYGFSPPVAQSSDISESKVPEIEEDKYFDSCDSTPNSNPIPRNNNPITVGLPTPIPPQSNSSFGFARSLR